MLTVIYAESAWGRRRWPAVQACHDFALTKVHARVSKMQSGATRSRKNSSTAGAGSVLVYLGDRPNVKICAGRHCYINVAAFPILLGSPTVSKRSARRSAYRSILRGEKTAAPGVPEVAVHAALVGRRMTRNSGKCQLARDDGRGSIPPLHWYRRAEVYIPIPSMGHARTQDLFPRVSRMPGYLCLDEVF